MRCQLLTSCERGSPQPVTNHRDCGGRKPKQRVERHLLVHRKHVRCWCSLVASICVDGTLRVTTAAEKAQCQLWLPARALNVGPRRSSPCQRPSSGRRLARLHPASRTRLRCFWMQNRTARPQKRMKADQSRSQCHPPILRPRLDELQSHPILVHREQTVDSRAPSPVL